jgi:hypothetical protein
MTSEPYESERGEKPRSIRVSACFLKLNIYLALPLLVPRVGAQDAHYAFAADDLAVAAHLLDGRTDFHF